MKLSTRQQEIFDFILAYKQEHGFPPTLKEMADSLCIKSKNAIFKHLIALERKHMIRRNGRSARAIEIVGNGKAGFSIIPVVKNNWIEIDKPRKAA